MKHCLSILVLLLLMATPGFAAADARPEGSPGPSSLDSAVSDSSALASGPYDFALGKLQLAEGDYSGAIEALQRAVKAAPEEPYVHLVLAETLLRIGRMAPAVEHADQAVALAPRDVDILGGAGRVLVSFGDRDPRVGTRGEGYFQQLLELNPDHLETLHILGSIHQRRGDLVGAERYFARLATLQPGPRSAGVLLQLYLDQGKKEEAIKLLREVLDHSPGELEMRLTLADLLVEKGDHAGAAAILMAAPEGVMDNIELARRTAVELYRSGDLPGALAALDPVLAENPSPRLRLFQGLLVAESGNTDRAVQILQGVHAEQPADPEVALSLARLLAQHQRSDEASTVLNETLEAMQDPDAEERVRMELAQIFAAEESWEMVIEQADALRETQTEAVRQAAALLRIDALIGLDRAAEAEAEFADLGTDLTPDLAAKYGEVLFHLGREDEARALLSGLRPADHAVEVYQRLGRFEESIPLLTGMVAENPESLQARFWLGAAYERTGRAEEAEGQFKELVRRYPDFHLGLNYLGYMYAERGENLQEALTLIQRAVGLDPGNGAYIDSLGWVYYQLGEYDEAVVHLRQASNLVPGDGTVFEHLGDAYLALGDRGNARDAYRRALGLELEDREKVETKLEEVDASSPDPHSPDAPQ
jgi:tetratricopeptide (TPR) repeat protein